MPTGVVKKKTARKPASRLVKGCAATQTKHHLQSCTLPLNSISTPNETIFSHEELDLSRREIRLLRILPTDDGSSVIECELGTFEFGLQPLYTAVSYTWGDQTTFKNIIMLNGQMAQVRDNLLAFLYATRDQHEVDWLWIDAICINQDDYLERNHQVGLMDKIYETAEQVLAWLGPAEDGSDGLMEAIAASSSYYRGKPTTAMTFEKCVHKDGVTVSPFEAFFSRAYWRRIWVVQEIMLASKVGIMCGHKRVELGLLRRYVADIAMARKSLEGHCASSILVNHRYFDRSHNRLKSVLELFMNFESTDIRDRVYGLLSLVPPDARIPIDYSKSIEQVFLDTMVKIGQNEDIGLEGDTNTPLCFWQRVWRSWKFEKGWEQRSVALKACQGASRVIEDQKKGLDTNSGQFDHGLRAPRIPKVLDLRQSLNIEVALIGPDDLAWSHNDWLCGSSNCNKCAHIMMSGSVTRRTGHMLQCHVGEESSAIDYE